MPAGGVVEQADCQVEEKVDQVVAERSKSMHNVVKPGGEQVNDCYEVSSRYLPEGEDCEGSVGLM